MQQQSSHARRWRSVICSVVCLAVGSPMPAQSPEPSIATLVGAYRNGDYDFSVPRLQTLANAGDPQAQALVCEASMMGRGMAKRAEPHAKCQQAADAGVPLAYGLLAITRMLGWPGVAANYEQAEALARRGAQYNDPRSVHVLGNLYFYGLGRPQSLTQARHYYERATQLGFMRARAMLAYLLSGVAGLPAEPAAALNHARISAGAGDPTGQWVMGMLHATASGVPRDMAEASRWYAAAARQGMADAQYELGLLLLQGDGVQKNPAEAARQFTAAAAQGHSTARLTLARQYATANGVARDDRLAVRLLQLNVDGPPGRDRDESMGTLGAMVFEGRGIARNEREGRALVARAVQSSSPEVAEWAKKVQASLETSAAKAPGITLKELLIGAAILGVGAAILSSGGSKSESSSAPSTPEQADAERQRKANAQQAHNAALERYNYCQSEYKSCRAHCGMAPGDYGRMCNSNCRSCSPP